MTNTETKLAIDIAVDISTRPEFAKYESPLILAIVKAALAVHSATRAQPASELPCEVTLPGQWKGDGTVTATRINGDMFIPTNEDGGVYVSRDVAAKFFGFTAQPASVADHLSRAAEPVAFRWLTPMGNGFVWTRWCDAEGQQPPADRKVEYAYTHPSEDARDRRMFIAGWRTAANWMDRDDLIADIGSPAWEADLKTAMAKENNNG